jgi:hypothetical protein
MMRLKQCAVQTATVFAHPSTFDLHAHTPVVRGILQSLSQECNRHLLLVERAKDQPAFYIPHHNVYHPIMAMEPY